MRILSTVTTRLCKPRNIWFLFLKSIIHPIYRALHFAWCSPFMMIHLIFFNRRHKCRVWSHLVWLTKIVFWVTNWVPNCHTQRSLQGPLWDKTVALRGPSNLLCIRFKIFGIFKTFASKNHPSTDWLTKDAGAFFCVYQCHFSLRYCEKIVRILTSVPTDWLECDAHAIWHLIHFSIYFVVDTNSMGLNLAETTRDFWRLLMCPYLVFSLKICWT